MYLSTGKLYLFVAGLSSVLAQLVTTSPTSTFSAEFPCLSQGMDILFLGDPEPYAAFATAVSTASLYSDLRLALPTDQCSFLAKLPSEARADYFTYLSRVQTWWKTQRTTFSEWSSTCTGQLYTGPYSTISEYYAKPISAYLEPTAQARLNDFTATAVTCPTTTYTTPRSRGDAPRKTAMAGAAIAAAAAVYAVGEL